MKKLQFRYNKLNNNIYNLYDYDICMGYGPGIGTNPTVKHPFYWEGTAKRYVCFYATSSSINILLSPPEIVSAVPTTSVKGSKENIFVCLFKRILSNQNANLKS